MPPVRNYHGNYILYLKSAMPFLRARYVNPFCGVVAPRRYFPSGKHAYVCLAR